MGSLMRAGGAVLRKIGMRARREPNVERRLMEPLLGLLPAKIADSPLRVALSFAVLSFGTSCLAACLERRLFSAEAGILPLWSNFSTLLDFLLLDPLIIFYILRSYKAICGINDICVRPPSKAVVLALSSLALAAMSFYASRFLGGSFRDACVTGKGIGSVTITGWLLFGWTTVFLYIVLCGAFNQLRYVGEILRLCRNGITYDPLHPDGSGGVRYLAQPALEFLRATIVLLFLFAGFYIYDKIVYDIAVSVRMSWLFVYLIVTPSLFVAPVFALHFALLRSRQDLLVPLSRKMGAVMASIAGDMNADAVAKEIDVLVKMRDQMLAFPVWPLPVRQMIESASYIGGPFLAYLPNAWSIFKSGFGI